MKENLPQVRKNIQDKHMVNSPMIRSAAKYYPALKKLADE